MPARPTVYDQHKATQKLFSPRRGEFVSRITIGTAPDSWGVWFPSDPEQVPAEHVPCARWPRRGTSGSSWVRTATCPRTRPSCRALDAHGLRVLAGTVFEHLHLPDSWDYTWSR